MLEQELDQDQMENEDSFEEVELTPTGRPKTKRGPRKIYYVVGVIKNGEQIVEEINAPVGPEEQFDRSQAVIDVRMEFTKQHDLTPGFVLGPYYQVRDALATSSNPRKRAKVYSNALITSQMRMSDRIGKGTHQGWEVFINFAQREGFGLVTYGKLVDYAVASKDGKKKPLRPNGGVMSLQGIENIQEIGVEESCL